MLLIVIAGSYYGHTVIVSALMSYKKVWCFTLLWFSKMADTRTKRIIKPHYGIWTYLNQRYMLIYYERKTPMCLWYETMNVPCWTAIINSFMFCKRCAMCIMYLFLFLNNKKKPKNKKHLTFCFGSSIPWPCKLFPLH